MQPKKRLFLSLCIFSLILTNGLMIVENTKEKKSSESPKTAVSLQATFLNVVKNGTMEVESKAWGGEKPYTLKWDFGDGTVIEDGDEKETHVYTQNGTYVVTHTVIDSNGDIATQEHEARVTISHFGDDVIVIDGFTHLAIIITGILALMIVGIKRKTRVI